MDVFHLKMAAPGAAAASPPQRQRGFCGRPPTPGCSVLHFPPDTRVTAGTRELLEAEAPLEGSEMVWETPDPSLLPSQLQAGSSSSLIPAPCCDVPEHHQPPSQQLLKPPVSLPWPHPKLAPISPIPNSGHNRDIFGKERKPSRRP